ncbi:hypothetical protein ACJ73_05222 [Blastomyces percursus]|uniref:Uncharacterized protein n=1 Tax=Blastomyces percursus TaxID=1658174 RepID=A0A1J9R710_9EURO|nr:hypothetical protein ACJ73_05222 [Blastomyces percursus]
MPLRARLANKLGFSHSSRRKSQILISGGSRGPSTSASSSSSSPSSSNRKFIFTSETVALKKTNTEPVRGLSDPQLIPPITPPDLWFDALQSFSSDDQQIQFSREERNVKRCCGKTIFWLNKFKGVGDVAVGCDQAPASLSWAGVRMILQVHSSLITNLQRVFMAIAKYDPTQLLQNPNKWGLARSRRNSYLPGRRCTVAKIWKIGLILKPATEGAVSRDSQLLDAKTGRLLEYLSTPIIRCDENVSSLLETVTDKERLEILDWISLALDGQNHSAAKDSWTPGTCEWLLDLSIYLTLSGKVQLVPNPMAVRNWFVIQ